MSVEVSLGQLTNQLSRLFRRLADKRLLPLGLSAGQLPILTALKDGQEMSQKALVDSSGIEQPTIAATLIRMERDGLVERRVALEDRRSSLFSLTDAAREKMAPMLAIVDGISTNAARGLSSDEVDRLRRSLDLLSKELLRALAKEP